ncbi:BadF/BadG/BcrA/BcrD ATPase family protein [Paenibacillus sediminis]|uniref:N-acetylglucosamine kinase-like BadF-type ATPase n=1 Tax=Paenibacillus sediminis TaxID=664909 RepID=A0ABS4H3Z9_9BACL|nr:BadF/BadG/BcrA/BcrD ATPase family protein [Paenibacillus sediminis]MBP1937176.1 N-acetylglucosamine kinase-like BadF-type ATPase [Paenibacillus sediminis]
MEIYIGVDGGGTKTEAAAITSDGKVLASYTGGSTNPYIVTLNGAIQELNHVLNQLLNQIKTSGFSCNGICLGMSGISSDKDKEPIIKFLQTYQQRQHLFFPITMKSEAEISLMAAVEREHGILVISGTGSNTFGIIEGGAKFNSGGWGHILGDEGSGYQIGLLTLKTVMKSYDGILPPTTMTKRIIETFGFQQISDLKSYVYQPSVGKTEIAAFAKYCIEEAEAGDEAACNIVRSQAIELADTTTALISKHPSLQKADVVLTGSIFKHSITFRSVYRETMLDRFPNLSFVQGNSNRSSAVGAALLARKIYKGTKETSPHE